MVVGGKRRRLNSIPNRSKGRRPYKKRRFFRRRLRIMNNPSAPIKPRMRVQLKYSESNLTISPGLGTTSGYVFRGNDVYDPNVTGTGHQPMGTDQWFSFYKKCTVLGSRIMVMFVSTESAGTVTQCVGICPQLTTTIPSTNVLYNELPRSKWGYIGLIQGGNPSKSITHQCYTRQMFDSRPKLDDADIQCTSSGSPTDQWYWHLYSSSIEGSDPGNVYINVTIVYDCIFHEPVQFTQS